MHNLCSDDFLLSVSELLQTVGEHVGVHSVGPNRHPAGQQLDSYYSTKILEMCLCKWIMKMCLLLKGLTAENKSANGHSQQNYILLDAGRGKFRGRRKKNKKTKHATVEKTIVSLIQGKKKVAVKEITLTSYTWWKTNK